MTSQTIRAVHDQLCYLHSLYRQLKTLVSRYNSARLRVNAQRKRTAEAETHSAEVKERHRRMVLEAREAEDRFNLIDSALQKRKTQLSEAKSNKEYLSLKEQIADDQRRNDALAEKTLELAEQAEEFVPLVEKAEREIAEAKEAQQTVEKEFRELVAAVKEDTERIQKELHLQIREVDRKFAAPLSQALASFDGDEAMAPVEGERYCGGCRMEIPMQYIVSLCEGNPYTCCSCGRFIYLPKGFVINNNEDD
jgi:predicted  nucleic acid-binding Zn-ribbon protein